MTNTLRYHDEKHIETYLESDFEQVLRKTGANPPGLYKINALIKTGDSVTETVIMHRVDSCFSVNHPLRRETNKLLKQDLLRQDNILAAKKIKNALPYRKLERHFRSRGIRMEVAASGEPGEDVLSFYYDNWYLGYYVVPRRGAAASDRIDADKLQLKNNPASFAGTDLESYQSVFSQFRTLRQGQKDHEEITGIFSWASQFNNEQEEFTQTDNNYHEFRGTVEAPVMDLPVTFDGYYTTQDRNRPVRASYFHVNYDSRKAREKLVQLLAQYKEAYTAAETKGAGYSNIYGAFLDEAEGRLDGMKQRFAQELAGAGPDVIALDTAGIFGTTAEQMHIRDQYSALPDAVSGIEAKGDAAVSGADTKYRALKEQYESVTRLEEEVTRYRQALDQYRNTLHFDSLLAYDKVKDLDQMDAISYKDLARKADRILPEGKARSFVTGLTSFDLGMFHKGVSAYTLGGQRLNGIDLGYDVRFAEAGISYGTTEYINRDGTVEGYKTFSGRLMSKPVAGQQAGLVYYTYSPGRKLLTENRFFKEEDVSLPSFRKPVHIISGIYNGRITKYATVNGEYALSRRQGTRLDESFEPGRLQDASAWNLQLAGQVPGTDVLLEGGYEHVGSGFENGTLPVIMSGTDKYRIAGSNSFFRSFLTLSVEYNYLKQQQLRYKGSNSRWGFQMQTHSRRYPSLLVSYKPFSTFRSYDDTLAVAQKPLLGDIWTGRLNYQIKRKGNSWRFVFMYNRNNSISDTVRYTNSVVQFTTIRQAGIMYATLNLGSTVMDTDMPLTGPAAWMQNSHFTSVSGGVNLDRWSVAPGSDIAWTSSGLTRYGVSLSGSYRLQRIPLMLRAQMRYLNYRTGTQMAWKPLYGGGLELIWQWRMKTVM